MLEAKFGDDPYVKIDLCKLYSVAFGVNQISSSLRFISRWIWVSLFKPKRKIDLISELA